MAHRAIQSVLEGVMEKSKTKACPVKAREQRLWNLYRLTPEDVEDMREAQDGRCQICGVPTVPGSKAHYAEVIDHCHKTGKVRGLLCSGCNTGLGCFRDDIGALLQAARYLDKHREQG